MGNKRYYQNGKGIGFKLNVIRPTTLSTAEIPPPLPTVTRAGIGGTAPTMPVAANITGSGNIISSFTTSAIISGNDLQYNNVSLSSSLVPGQSINGIIIGYINYIPFGTGTNPLNGNIGGQLYYIGSGITKPYPGAFFQLVVPPGGGPANNKAAVRIVAGAPVPLDYSAMSYANFTVTLPSAAPTSYNYSINLPVDYPLPANVTVEYNDSAVTTTTEVIPVSADGQLLKNFPLASDPVAAFSGTFTITAATNGTGNGSSPAPFGGWSYEFPRPFVIIGRGLIDNLGTGGGPEYEDGDWIFNSNNENVEWTTGFYQCFKLALINANANGIVTTDFSERAISLLPGQLSESFAEYFKDIISETQNQPQIWAEVLAGEMLARIGWNNATQHTEPLETDPDGATITQIMNNVKSFTDLDLWGAPGLYFVPNEVESEPGVNSPYWAGFNAAVLDGEGPALVVLELKIYN